MRTLMRTSLHVAIFVAFGLTPITVLSQIHKDEWAGGYAESQARKAAIKKVMPVYPEEALRQGISGRVEFKIAITQDGEVGRIKFHPRTDLRLKTAIADAVKQWKFKPRPDRDELGRPILSRLTFNFLASESRVELYNASPSAPDSYRAGYHNFQRDRREWRDWEEIEISQRSPQADQP